MTVGGDSYEIGAEFETRKILIPTESYGWKSYLPSFCMVFFIQIADFLSCLSSSQLLCTCGV